MSGSEVRQRAVRPLRPDGTAFDLVVAKLRSPMLRPGTVWRSAAIDRLMRDDGGPVVSVVAPAGYGKTTLLSQWAERDGRAFAWVSVDDADNDPKILLAYIAEALDAIEPVGERLFDALASPASSVPGSVVPRLGSAFSAMSTPVVLVLDDVHLLQNTKARPRCRFWPITCRPGPAWRSRGGPRRRCGSPGYARRAGSPRSAPVTCH